MDAIERIAMLNVLLKAERAIPPTSQVETEIHYNTDGTALPVYVYKSKSDQI